jgi:hypothetical protein
MPRERVRRTLISREHSAFASSRRATCAASREGAVTARPDRTRRSDARCGAAGRPSTAGWFRAKVPRPFVTADGAAVVVRLLRRGPASVNVMTRVRPAWPHALSLAWKVPDKPRCSRNLQLCSAQTLQVRGHPRTRFLGASTEPPPQDSIPRVRRASFLDLPFPHRQQPLRCAKTGVGPDLHINKGPSSVSGPRLGAQAQSELPNRASQRPPPRSALTLTWRGVGDEGEGRRWREGTTASSQMSDPQSGEVGVSPAISSLAGPFGGSSVGMPRPSAGVRRCGSLLHTNPSDRGAGRTYPRPMRCTSWIMRRGKGSSKL